MQEKFSSDKIRSNQVAISKRSWGSDFFFPLAEENLSEVGFETPRSKKGNGHYIQVLLSFLMMGLEHVLRNGGSKLVDR